MTGFRVVRNGELKCHVVYGDVRGGHVKVFAETWERPPRFNAWYYAGDDGVLLGAWGVGRTPAVAVRALWRQMHGG